MEQCFICKNSEVKEKFILPGYYTYKCRFCGEYGLDESFHDNVISDGEIVYIVNGRKKKIKTEEFYSQAPLIAAERMLQGKDKYLLVYDSDLENAQKYSSGMFTPIGIRAFLDEYPQDAIDMFNRILVNLGCLITHPSETFIVNQQFGGTNAYFYSKDIDSTYKICSQLEALEWIKIQPSGQCGIISILPKGWLALRELQKTSRNSDKVFVAMWFTKETNNLRNAVERAVKAAGYRPEEITVDTTQHNDYIMNKVINMITDAKFVIADLTCLPEKIVKGKVSCGVRGGVYFEAGFARGQGKEVIHTCKKTPESIDRLHFDVHQINTIFWEEDGNGVLKSYDSDFIDVLKHRIIATVGKGKHYKE